MLIVATVLVPLVMVRTPPEKLLCTFEVNLTAVRWMNWLPLVWLPPPKPDTVPV
jgi:hypothetical protein